MVLDQLEFVLDDCSLNVKNPLHCHMYKAIFGKNDWLKKAIFGKVPVP